MSSNFKQVYLIGITVITAVVIIISILLFGIFKYSLRNGETIMHINDKTKVVHDTIKIEVIKEVEVIKEIIKPCTLKHVGNIATENNNIVEKLDTIK